MRPSTKRFLLVIPGFLLALAGLVLFAFCETDENYWYTHSLWHILIASSILFFLPHNKRYTTGKTKTKEAPNNTFLYNRLVRKDQHHVNLPLILRKTSGEQ